MAVHALTLGPSISVMQFDPKGGAAMKHFFPCAGAKSDHLLVKDTKRSMCMPSFTAPGAL